MEKKPLRSGFTTGTCAAAAAKGAAAILFTGQRMEVVTIMTRKGTAAVMSLSDISADSMGASCSVVKDAGDDPDITNGAVVRASVSYIDDNLTEIPDTWYWLEPFPGLYLKGGAGVGVVTKPGLSCPVGMAAINPVPRKMIGEGVWEMTQQYGIFRRLLITIEIPDGRLLAEKTFNPRLGIIGGVSVLGTTGVVEPMSEQALLETIRLEIHMKAVEGNRFLILTPGNYGEAFLQNTLGLSLGQAVKCSNFSGDAIAMMEEEGFRGGLIAGHIGKLIKVAGGMKNTHSKYGDGRMSTLWQCVEESLCEGDNRLDLMKEKILSANTTEEAVGYLEEAGWKDRALALAAYKVKEQILEWSHGKIWMEVVTFSLGYGILGKTENADAMVSFFKQKEGSE